MDKLSDPLLGHMIRGYRLEELLESDAVTKVYRGHTQELWQTSELIITILNLPVALSPQTRERFIERFLREARRIVRLRHKLLFPLFGYGKQNGHPYLLTPNVSGVTLTTYMKQKQSWSPPEAFTILVPIAKALTYIHSQGLIYEFLNPTNIFLQDSKVPQIAKLNYSQILRMDGISDEATASSPYAHLKNIAGGYLGAAEYLAPEVVKGAPADPRSDVYSLGVILFRLLSGQPPFTGRDYLEIAQMHVCKPLPSIHDIKPNIPVALELVLNHALYRNLEHRFQTPEDFVTAYAHVLDGPSQVQTRPQAIPAGEQVRTVPTAPLAKSSKVLSFEEKEQEQIQSFERGREKLSLSERGREDAFLFKREPEETQIFEEELEDDSWLNAAGPVHRQPSETKVEKKSNSQFLPHRKSIPPLDQKRPKIGR
jgi:serine/threonine protein kinase